MVGTPLANVNLGIAALRGLNFTGPFHAIVDAQAYAAVYTPVPPAAVGTAQQIAAVLHGGRLVDSPVLFVPNTGFVFSLGGGPIDLTVSVDLQVEVLNEERGALLRLVEQFCLRIKNQNAIVAL
jgi:uncharacterized linocin/CFP29 family protein